MVTMKGRQALLNHQFSVLAYQRDIITILDNLNSVKNEVQNINKKVDSNLVMAKTTPSHPMIPKSSKHSHSDHDIDEEQKVLKDESYSHSNDQDEYQHKSKASSQALDESFKKRYKDKVKSINTIVNRRPKA